MSPLLLLLPDAKTLDVDSQAAKGGGNAPNSMSTRSRMTLERENRRSEHAESVPGGMLTA